MTAIKIEGAGYPIKDIFSDRFSFNIPNYQRPYAWTTEETEKLLDDLLDAMEDESTDINEIPPYFLGNIVLIKLLDKTECEVVDGQQRLTTLTILFAVLRKLRQEEGLTKYICQPKDEDAGTSARSRLHLRERDREFFEKYIQNSDGLEKIETIVYAELSDPQRNLIENARILLKKIAEKLPEESQKQRLTQFLLQRCYLVVVSTPDFDSAYRIFSVINDRGLDLSITDILKADAIGKISQQRYSSLQERQEIEARYTRKWEDLEKTLGRDAFTELFSHIRMIYRKSKLSQKVIDEFRKYVLTKINNFRHFIDDILTPFSDAFYDIRNCTFNSDRNSQEINQLFKWLQRIDNSDWIPPSILYLKKYRHEPEKLLLFFTDLERLAAGLMILRANVNERIKRYAAILEAIEKDEDLCSLDSPLQLTNLEQQEIINVLNGNFYQMYKINLYVLLRLDTVLSDGIPNYDSYNAITIEHVLPQSPKPDSQWINWFSTEQEREKYVHRLGNLVLLSRRKNSSAQNFEFNYKKEKYFNTPTAVFSLTIQVIKETEWTPTIIEKRQKYLLEQIKKLWRLSC
jgi:uncharacterized protein with ParB-like and HNH nuclease domain